MKNTNIIIALFGSISFGYGFFYWITHLLSDKIYDLRILLIPVGLLIMIFYPYEYEIKLNINGDVKL